MCLVRLVALSELSLVCLVRLVIPSYPIVSTIHYSPQFSCREYSLLFRRQFVSKSTIPVSSFFVIIYVIMLY